MKRCQACGQEVRDRPIVGEADIERILYEVGDEHGVTVAQLKGPSRRRDIADARNCAEWRLRTELGLMLKEIGLALGGRHHTTILHGIRRAENGGNS